MTQLHKPGPKKRPEPKKKLYTTGLLGKLTDGSGIDLFLHHW